MDIIAKAYKDREKIEIQAQTMPEKDVSQLPWMCRHLHGDGELVRAGTRIQWDGQVLKAESDLWDRPENWPDKAPTLWKEIKYRDGIRIIPDHISTTEAFDKGEAGWWKGGIYISRVAANVYTPEAYPRAWKRKEV